MTAGQTNPPVALNPDLNVEGLKQRFAETGRLQIKNVLHPETAARLHQCLTQETPWMIAYNEGYDAKYLTQADMAAMPPLKRNSFMQNIFARAADNFQYVYNDFPVSGTMNIANQPKFYTHDVLHFLRGSEFGDLIKRLTGMEGEFLVDSHATCFQAGHFLSSHTDLHNKTDPRRLAYVLSMTPEWKGDWGAATVFFDDDGEILESFVPSFNTFTTFKVPQNHSVSFVPPFCTQGRFAMSGWFYRPDKT